MTTQELIGVLLGRTDITIEQADVLMAIAIDNGDYSVTSFEHDLDQLDLDLHEA